jgi:hypothetical protein
LTPSVGINQILLPEFTLAVLLNGSGQVRCVRWRLQQVHGLHQSIECVQGHQHGIWRITPGNDGEIGVSDDLINDALEATPGLREINDSHDGHLYLNNIRYKYILNLLFGLLSLFLPWLMVWGSVTGLAAGLLGLLAAVQWTYYKKHVSACFGWSRKAKIPMKSVYWFIIYKIL